METAQECADGKCLAVGRKAIEKVAELKKRRAGLDAEVIALGTKIEQERQARVTADAEAMLEGKEPAPAEAPKEDHSRRLEALKAASLKLKEQIEAQAGPLRSDIASMIAVSSRMIEEERAKALKAAAKIFAIGFQMLGAVNGANAAASTFMNFAGSQIGRGVWEALKSGRDLPGSGLEQLAGQASQIQLKLEKAGAEELLGYAGQVDSLHERAIALMEFSVAP